MSEAASGHHMTESETMAQVVEDTADFPFREPIVDDYDPAIHDKRDDEDSYLPAANRAAQHELETAAERELVDHQWLQLTEVVRREMHDNPQLRETVAGFDNEELGEALPGEFIEAIGAESERVARFSRFFTKLDGQLQIEPIPDSAIHPDIGVSRTRLAGPEPVRERLANILKDMPQHYQRYLEEDRQRPHEQGITDAEQKLIAQRYRYAREVLLLGLSAELQDNPFNQDQAVSDEGSTIEHQLPSGVKMTIDSEAQIAHPNLLDPQTWQGRRRLKDRVNTIWSDGQSFLMKERKTPRHTDLNEHGHIDGLTSREEFETAQHFARLGTIEVDQGDIQLRWEKPLGFVEFPAGYQFVVFEAEKNMIDPDGGAHVAMMNAIRENPEHYADEFNDMREAAKKLMSERPDLLEEHRISGKRGNKRKLPFTRAARAHNKYLEDNDPEGDDLTFDEFGQVKALNLVRKARDELEKTTYEQGYEVIDDDGYGFKVVEQPSGKPALEIIGFDFEYYTRDQNIAQERLGSRAESKEDPRNNTWLGLSGDWNRPIAQAANWVMLERQGYMLPEKQAQ